MASTSSIGSHRPPAAPVVPPVVSVLIISYNTRALTLACLASLAEQTSLPHEIIVVDNASRDGSAAAIAAAFPAIDLVAHPDNLGFAGGNNLAAARARGEYLLLLTPTPWCSSTPSTGSSPSPGRGPRPASGAGARFFPTSGSTPPRAGGA